jgi:hypothetical protein
MNKLLIPILVVGLLGKASSQTTDAVNAPLTVAVLNFETSDEKQQGKAAEVATLLSNQLSTKPELWLVERSEIDKILGEQTINLSGMADPASAVRAGKLLGAKALVTGRIISTPNSAILVAKVMSTENSRVFGESVTTISLDSLEKPAADLADKVNALLAKQTAVFNPTVEKPEDEIARLKKLVEGKTLPSLQISIAERDIARPTVDPAVETEFKKIFGELGFLIFDSKASDKAADVIISGEAFSETGSRRGQLVCARGRAEVQAVRRSDGVILNADSQTESAVGTADATTGKSALQLAARKLVGRMAPKLVAK